MKNRCEVLSQKLVYLTNLVTMFKLNLGKPGTWFYWAKTRKMAAEDLFCLVQTTGRQLD